MSICSQCSGYVCPYLKLIIFLPYLWGTFRTESTQQAFGLNKNYSCKIVALSVLCRGGLVLINDDFIDGRNALGVFLCTLSGFGDTK